MRSALVSRSSFLSAALVALTSACSSGNQPTDEAVPQEVVDLGLAARARSTPGFRHNFPVANLRVTDAGARDNGAGLEQMVYVYNLGPDRSGPLTIELRAGQWPRVRRLPALAPNHRRLVSLGPVGCSQRCQVAVLADNPVQDPDQSDNGARLQGAMLSRF